MSMKKWLLTGAAACALVMTQTQYAEAQATTGGLHGQVIGSDGAPVAGASIELKSDSTGATLTTSSGSDGSFTFNSLSVSGTYTATVSAPGYATKTYKSIGVSLGNTSNIEFDLAILQAETVVVTGVREQNAATAIVDSRGLGTTFTSADIAQTPTVSRDFKDIIQRVPYATIDPVGASSSPPTPTYSIAGSNPRCSNLLVDGLQQKDNFGLNEWGYPTHLAPVPLDWVDQFQLYLTPYDVQYNDTCGGVINITTKQGSNDYHASAYIYIQNDSLNGKEFANWNATAGTTQVQTGAATPAKPAFDWKDYGGTVSGAIVPDKLFFFVGYDEVKNTYPLGAQADGPQGGGYANSVPNVTTADVAQVQSIAQSVYGFNAGNFNNSYTEYHQRYIGKLTWQINDDQALNLVYQRSTGSTLAINNGSTSTTLPYLTMPSNWYANQQTMEVYSADYNSHWTSDFTTDISIGHEGVTNNQTPLDGTDFPEVDVADVQTTPANLAANGFPSGTAFIRLGPDFSRQYNFLYYKNDYARAIANYTLDDHNFEFGFEFHRIGIDDKFVQGAQSVVRFDSISDFQNQIISKVKLPTTQTNAFADCTSQCAGNPVYISTGPGGNNSIADGKFQFDIASFYGQDDWTTPIDHLSVTYGIRYDRYMTSSDGAACASATATPGSTSPLCVIQPNPYFKQRYGFSNTLTVDGLDALLPRFSAKYDLTPDFAPDDLITLRTVIGEYSGGIQTVWLTNDYDTTGTNQVNASGIPGQGAFSTVPTLMPTNHQQWLQDLITGPLSQASVLTTSTTDAQLPNFKLPSDLRMDFGFDILFGPSPIGDNWKVTFDYVNQNDYNSPYWTNLRVEPIPGVTAPDGRFMYQLTFDGVTRKDPVTGGALTGTDIGMGSIDGGNTTLFTIEAGNKWEDTPYGDISLDFGYAHTKATEIMADTSSTASSEYTYTARINYNDPSVGVSDYQHDHRFTFDLGVVEHFFGDLKTAFDIFGDRQSGEHYSMVYSNNPFGPSNDGLTGRSLIYVPKADSTGNVSATSDPIVTYAAGFDFTGFNSMLQSTGLIKYNGRIVPRNSQSGPWDTLVNFSTSQELEAFDSDHRLKVTLSIFDLPNLLNPAWGADTEPNFSQANGNPTITANIVNGKYQYTAFSTQAQINSNLSTNRSASTYQIEFGVAYDF